MFVPSAYKYINRHVAPSCLNRLLTTCRFLSDVTVFLDTLMERIGMRVFLRTFGCSTNQADGEVMSGCLFQAGFTLVRSVSSADVVVYNSCGVKGPTENRIVDALKRIPNGKRVVVAGCLPLISFDRLLRETRFDALIGPAAGKDIVDVVRRVAAGEHIVKVEGAISSKPVFNLPRTRSNPVVSVVSINYGCLGSCAYCCVVHARGRLRSYSIEEIVERVKHDLGAGAREFWLTSQDTACYGRDIGTNLAELLTAVCAVEGDFHVRVGMMTPNAVSQILGEVVQAFACEKVYKFLHLPVQSGDNEVLQRMYRFYTTDEYKRVVAGFRLVFPRLTLSTDIICGFPGESASAFENTLVLLHEIKPDVVNVSKFFARPKTQAAKMHEYSVQADEIKRRSTLAAALAKQLSSEANAKWVGWKGDILVSEKGKLVNTWVGRNFAYKPVTLRSSRKLLGKTICVEITETFPTYLLGAVER